MYILKKRPIFVINKKIIMGKKLVWFEKFTTICKYTVELTDEEATLFQEDENRFYDEVDYRSNQDLEFDKIVDEESYDFSIEEE
jgi:hypothetical protein